MSKDSMPDESARLAEIRDDIRELTKFLVVQNARILDKTLKLMGSSDDLLQKEFELREKELTYAHDLAQRRERSARLFDMAWESYQGRTEGMDFCGSADAYISELESCAEDAWAEVMSFARAARQYDNEE